MSTIRSTYPLPPFLAALALSCVLGLYGCSSDDAPPGPNQLPRVELQSAPPEGSETEYRIRIGWTGSDPDGYLTRYEYVVDPPEAFTEAEIRTGEGVSQTVLQAEHGVPDRTRTSKEADGKTVSFDWLHTDEYNREFLFTAGDNDSTCVDTTCAATGRASGCHTVYVRAVDDRDGMSDAARVAFIATTLVPTTGIVTPDIQSLLTNVGENIRFGLVGDDPDGPAVKRFLYKLVDLSSLDPPKNILQPLDETELFERLDTSPWLSHEGSELSPALPGPGQYGFAVRAVDEAGAADPFLEYGRNAVRFQATSVGGIPATMLRGRYLPPVILNASEQSIDLDTPVGLPVDLEIACSGEAYGGSCGEYRWGVDLADLEEETAWSDWLPSGTLPFLQFDADLSHHFLYIQVRDEFSTVTTITIRIRVLDFSLDFSALVVDDRKDTTFPRDADSDSRWTHLVETSGRFDGLVIDAFSAHGQGDFEVLNPLRLSVESMSRYRTIVWDVLGAGYNGRSALLTATAISRDLGMYLDAGGTLWLSGQLSVGAMSSTSSGSGDFSQPNEPGPGSFAWDSLKMFAVADNNQGEDLDVHSLVAVLPAGEAPYPRLDIVPERLNQVQRRLGGVTGVDALIQVMNPEEVEGFTGIWESVYEFGAAGPLLHDRGSRFHESVVGYRWHDPDPARTQGRVQWFGFPPYYFEDAGVQEMFNRTVDWFREETGP